MEWMSPGDGGRRAGEIDEDGSREKGEATES